MRVLLILLAFLISLKLEAQAIRKDGVTICYFSLNNTDEYFTMKGFADQLNKDQNGGKINVVEYMQPKGDPEASFRRMVESNAPCDALVISGHHTGAWGGKNSKGTMKLDFLEKMSCDPKHKAWFERISALWLQGCRTLGVNKLEANDTADFHAGRVGQDREADGLYQSYAEMNHEFTMTLDQDNPLSTRYLKTFPRATTFGWTKSAPGEKSKSDRSLLFHIAHMASINAYNKTDGLVNPISPAQITANAAQLAVAALDIIQKPHDQCQKLAMTSWIKHGGKFNNTDIAAYGSFDSTSTSQERYARELGCRLKNANSQSERISALREILSSRQNIATNFNSIIEMVLKSGLTAADKNEISSLLKNSPNLRSFVGDKINSKQTGIFPKIDYYTFFKRVYGERSADIERIIGATSIEYLSKPFPANQESVQFRELASYKAYLIDSLARNKFADKAFMEKLYNKGGEEAQISFLGIYDTSDDEQMKSEVKHLKDTLRSF